MLSLIKKITLVFTLLTLLSACSLFSDDKKDKYSDWTAEDFQVASKEALEDESYKKAIKLLEQLDSRFPFGKHTAQAQLDLSYAYYKNDEPETAQASVERFIKTHPRHKSIDYAYYLKALINFNHNLGFLDRYIPSDSTQRDMVFTQTAYLNFEELIRRFPNSEYVDDAKQRMIALKNALARHELHIARFYMDREAFLAAANRANYILTHYQKTPAVPYALQLQIEAYKILKLDQLAADSETLYAYNFPNGPLMSEADKSDVVVIPFLWDILSFDQ